MKLKFVKLFQPIMIRGSLQKYISEAHHPSRLELDKGLIWITIDDKHLIVPITNCEYMEYIVEEDTSKATSKRA